MEHDTHNDAARPWLEVVRGLTRFPRREIHAERFLIGSGPSCHLRLGGKIPPICCVVHRDGAALWIDSLLPDPELLVNGRRVEGAYLRDGDLVQIGDFEFVVHIPPGLARQSELPDNALVDTHVRPEELEGFDPESLGALSVEELIDRLEADLALLKQERARRRDGMAALLEAVRRVRPESDVHPPPDDDASARLENDDGSHADDAAGAEPQEPRADRSSQTDGAAEAEDDAESMEAGHAAEHAPATVVAGSASHRAETLAEPSVGADAAGAGTGSRDEAGAEVSKRIGRLAAELRQISLLVEAAEPSRRDAVDWQLHAAGDGKVPPATTVDRYVAARLNVLAEELDSLQAEVLQRRQRRVA